jgi:hypothetical protein
MTLLIGLGLIVLLLLTYGHGLMAAVGLWVLVLIYTLLNPMPDYVFASWLAGAGLAAFVVQLALNLGGGAKKK